MYRLIGTAGMQSLRLSLTFNDERFFVFSLHNVHYRKLHAFQTNCFKSPSSHKSMRRLAFIISL